MGRIVKIQAVFSLFFLISSCSTWDEIYMGIESFPGSLDPVHGYRFYTTQVTNQIFETLITLDDDYRTIKPNLAIQWDQSQDGRVYTFRLRPGITFHNQRELSAQDIKYSVDRYKQHRPSWILADLIQAVLVLDSLTVSFTLERPYSQFLYMLCSPYIFLVMQNDDRVVDDEFSPVGTGPFLLRMFTPDEMIELRRNDDYWQPNSSVRKISFIFQSSVEERQSAIINNDVDILYLISGFEIDRLRWKGEIEYCVKKSSNTLFFGFNLENPPFDDIRVRRAVLHALDLPKIVHNLNRGNAQVARGPLPPVYRPVNQVWQEKYDPEKARALLSEAGYPDGIKIRCNFPKSGISRKTVVEMVESELAKSGIYVTAFISDSWDQHTDSIFSSNAQLFFDGSESMFIGEPEYFLRTLFDSESRYNFFRYKNLLVDSLLEMAREENNGSERRKAYDLIVKEIIKDTPAVFFSHVIPHFAYNSKKIRKMSANPYRIIDFSCMELYE
jgi:peptide/nickel transport system substrate-binding protein